MTAIHINKASYSYKDETLVLNGIELKIKEGEFIGLIGPNGSGKTTLLRLINKTLKASASTVAVYDNDINSMSHKAIARIIGTVGQDTTAPFSFTVKQIVMMGRSPHLSRWQNENAHDIEIVAQAMAMTETTELADRFISELSGGERQRVMIAQALAQEPKILLLDEPTSHLDIKHQLSILRLISDLNASGITIVGVFHDLDQAARYCNKLALLSKGSIYAFGQTRDVLTSANIKEVYGIAPLIEDCRYTGKMRIRFIDEEIHG